MSKWKSVYFSLRSFLMALGFFSFCFVISVGALELAKEAAPMIAVTPDVPTT